MTQCRGCGELFVPTTERKLVCRQACEALRKSLEAEESSLYQRWRKKKPSQVVNESVELNGPTSRGRRSAITGEIGATTTAIGSAPFEEAEEVYSDHDYPGPEQ